jgi:hypothetical protein
MTPTVPKTPVSVCCGTAIERPRFYARQIITADDLTLDQDYSREKFRRHARFLHGWGVVCGATLEYTTKPWIIRVTGGYILDPCGSEIVLCKDVCFDVRTRCMTTTTVPDPCADVWQPPAPAATKPVNVFVAIAYAQTQGRPVRVKAAGCGCGENQCESSRWQDGYTICVLDTLPDSHTNTKPQTVPITEGLPPACPPVITDPWVVLGQAIVQPDGTISQIVYSNCRRQVVSFADCWWRPTDPAANPNPSGNA